MTSDELLLDDDELLPGEMAFSAAELQRRVDELEGKLVRLTEESTKAATQLTEETKEDYQRLFSEKCEVSAQLDMIKEALALQVDINSGVINIDGAKVFQRVMDLDRDREIAVIALRFIARRVSDGEITLSSLPTVDKNIYTAIKEWAGQAPGPFMGDFPEEKMLGEWLMKCFSVGDQVGGYANISGRIQDLLTEDESEDFHKYMDKVPIIDPLGKARAHKLKVKMSKELAVTLQKTPMDEWNPESF